MKKMRITVTVIECDRFGNPTDRTGRLIGDDEMVVGTKVGSQIMLRTANNQEFASAFEFALDDIKKLLAKELSDESPTR